MVSNGAQYVGTGMVSNGAQYVLFGSMDEKEIGPHFAAKAKKPFSPPVNPNEDAASDAQKLDLPSIEELLEE